MFPILTLSVLLSKLHTSHSFLNLYQQFKCIFKCKNMHSILITKPILLLMFLQIILCLGFYPYMSLTVHVRLVKHTARRSLIEAMIVQTTPDFICFTS